MKARDAMITGAVAALTMMAATLILAPTAVTAADGRGQPAIVVDGVVLTLDTLRTSPKPTACLTAINTTDAPATIRADLILMAERPTPPHARMRSMPEERWSAEQVFVLAPLETKKVEVQAKKRVPKRSTGQFVLRAGERAVRTAFFAPAPTRVGSEIAAHRPEASQAPLRDDDLVNSGLDLRRRQPQVQGVASQAKPLAAALANEVAPLELALTTKRAVKKTKRHKKLRKGKKAKRSKRIKKGKRAKPSLALAF